MVKVRGIYSGESIKTLRISSKAEVSSIAVKGNILLINSYNRTIKIWDIETLELIRVLKGHKNFILQLSTNEKSIFLLNSTL